MLYNRHVLGSEENVAQTFKEAHVALEDALAFDDLTAFVNALETPRKIILMVNAGTAVDEVLDDLSSLLTSGDIVLDGGNSHYLNTQRRIKTFSDKGLHFLGAGISGGEKGALEGPSIMPSGNGQAYGELKPFWKQLQQKMTKEKRVVHMLASRGVDTLLK